MEILQVFVAFSEYINFKRQDSNTKQFLEVSLKDSRMKNFYPLPKSKICCDSIEKALKVLLEVLISWISLPRLEMITLALRTARPLPAASSPKKQSNVEVFYGLYYCFPC